jgi:hypothetical protein
MNGDGSSNPAKGTLKCHKTGHDVPLSHPLCPAPDEACKYRSECMIYALEQDAREARKKKRAAN